MSAPAAPRAPALSAKNLTVRRGERLLFENLALAVAPGGILLLRGPNGIGKSTLLLTLAGIICPDAGEVIVDRPDPDLPAGRLLHFLGHLAGIKPRLTVLENLAFWQALNGGDGEPQTALERVGLGGLEAIEAGHLSAGQGKRLALARLLVTRRPIWLLDEPGAALDAAGETLLGQLLDAHRADGGLAVVATHYDLRLADPAGVATLTLGAA
jgi:heme exporter protein A